MKAIAEDEVLKTLVDLGLTRLQARTYIATAELGEATIKSIAKESKVARQNIYQTMISLQQLGLIEKILEMPVKFRALPLKEAVDMLFRRRSQDYTRLKTEAEELEKSSIAINHFPEVSHEFIMIPQEEAHWRRVEQSICRAQKTIHVIMCLSGSSETPGNRLPKPFRDAIERGVRVKVISNQPQDTTVTHSLTMDTRKGMFEIRFSRVYIPVMFCSIDEREVFFAVEPTRDPMVTSALWTMNPGLLMIVEDFFNRMWRGSKPVENLAQ